MTTDMDRPIQRSFLFRKRRWLTGIVVIAIFIAGTMIFGSAFSGRSVRLDAATLTFGIVERGVYHDFIPLRGKAVAHDTVYLDALEGGRVDRVMVEPGDSVEKGQALIKLSNTALELDVLDREGRLIESMTQLQSYQTSLEQNHTDNEKALASLDYNIVRLNRSLARRTSMAGNAEPVELKDQVQDELNYYIQLRPIQVENNRKQEELRLRQLPQIQAEILKLQQDVKDTRSKLDSLTVRAPVSGRMTALNVKVGENRNHGERFGEITQDTGYKISAEIDEYYLDRLRNDQVATVQIADSTAQLHVTRIYPQVKNGVFTVELDFNGMAPASLVPGQAVQGRLALGNDVTTTILPAGPFLERTGGDWVFVLTKDRSSATRRHIKIGRRNNEQVEILSGLEPGEIVITSDYTGLERADRVDIKK